MTAELEESAWLRISLRDDPKPIDTLAVRGTSEALEALATEIRGHGYSATLDHVDHLADSTVRRPDEIRRDLYWLFED
jgi:hypothetical protein